MSRDDILSLTRDDLATITNHGTVKRAERELEAAELSVDFRETDDGTLFAAWSDGTICRFPAGAPLKQAVCSSGTIGISRHVVRSVLAYQQHQLASAPAGATASESAGGAIWDPGAITDAQL